MKTTDFDYNLPKELIAQRPAEKRENSRLMVVDRQRGDIEHRHFYNIADYLDPGDCLVLNESKVFPARLRGVKVPTGAKVEFLLVKKLGEGLWESMVRPGKRLKPGDKVSFGPELSAEITGYSEDGTRAVSFSYEGDFFDVLERVGQVPLPHYIDRENEAADRERYQTVYAGEEGSVAAPTAGLHFTRELLEQVQAKGVKIAKVRLNVGIGTFRPVTAENIEDHKMHFEEYFVSKEAADTINETKAVGGRIIAVGTTSVRTLESAAVETATFAKSENTDMGEDLYAFTFAKKAYAETTGKGVGNDAGSDNDGTGSGYILKEGSGETGIFIYPGYKFKLVDSLITNFHLPKSTLLMLISAFYDREKILDAYAEAVREEYRFFSYGDAMLIK